MSEQYLSLDDLARLTGQTYAHVYRMYKLGKIEATFKIGKRAVFTQEIVEQLKRMEEVKNND